MSALRVAVVGAGPAGAYAAGHLVARDGVEVELFDRLPTPWGLVRAGVAPDHQLTKSVARTFEWTARAPNCGLHLNVEVGTHVSHAELLAHHHAVVYSTGAHGSRVLEIEGEALPGSHAATEFVAWYNGHPEHADTAFDLSGRRVVIVGNGNVALDVARILTLDEAALRATDIADHALDAITSGAVEEVVVLGRRGPAQAAFTSPELLALTELDDVDLIVDPAEARLDDLSAAWLDSDAHFGARLKVRLLEEIAARTPRGARRRIVLRFLRAPVRIVGADRVEGIEVERNEMARSGDALKAASTGETEIIETGLVLRSVGYLGYALEGVAFDERRATIPNVGGRVVDDAGAPTPGVYTTGWIRRGPSGVIGTNKQDSGEMVQALLDDHAAGRLPAPAEDGAALRALLAERQPERVDLAGWAAIDAYERAAGERAGRPRVKLTDPDTMVQIASGRS